MVPAPSGASPSSFNNHVGMDRHIGVCPCNGKNYVGPQRAHGAQVLGPGGALTCTPDTVPQGDAADRMLAIRRGAG